MQLSIVIPAYNEEQRLPSTLRAIADWRQSAESDLQLREILVVDDGSTDSTVTAARDAAGALPVRVLRLDLNCGKGAAIRLGMREAAGDVILFYDADAATPPGEIGKLWTAMREGNADVVIGSRLNDAAHIDAHRRLIGRVYHFLSSGLIPGIGDAACGCKLFTRRAAAEIFSRQTVDRFAFDIEILALARKLGYRIREVPVQWVSVPSSKVRLVRDGLEMLWRLFTLYVRILTGRFPASRLPCQEQKTVVS